MLLHPVLEDGKGHVITEEYVTRRARAVGSERR